MDGMIDDSCPLPGPPVCEAPVFVVALDLSFGVCCPGARAAALVGVVCTCVSCGEFFKLLSSLLYDSIIVTPTDGDMRVAKFSALVRGQAV